MIGEECKFVHSAPCRKYLENPERGCRAPCKAYHTELCNYSRVTRERYNNRCFRMHLKGASRKQTPTATQAPSTTPRISNQQQAMIATQNLAYNRPSPLITLPTPHTTSTHLAPSPTHYHTPPATRHLTTHQTTFPLYPNPPPFHAIPCTASPSSTATQFLYPPQPSALAPQTYYPTFPRIVIQPQSHTPHLDTQDGYQQKTQRGTTANDLNIFLREVMHNVQQQLNNMMAVMNPAPASWGKPTYT